MRPRAITAWYQIAARVWLTLAGLSLLLPAGRRVGIWLPLHLALAGAVATAISGAMQMARPGHPETRRRSLAAFEVAAPVQLVFLNAGFGLMALRSRAGWDPGRPTSA